MYKISQTPDRQCICDQCENFRLLRLAFKNNKIHGIKEHTEMCIKQSLCKVTNSNTNDDNSNVEQLHQVDSSYGHFRCINHNCKFCGPDQVLLEILQNNEGIGDDITLVEWQHWDWIEKKGSKFKQLDIETKKTTKKELIDQCIADLHSMAFHLFSCNWNYSMFLLCKDNLRPRELLQVLDFGQNYMNVYQDKPQGVHWDHSQTVILPIVKYYLEDSGNLVTEEHIMLNR